VIQVSKGTTNEEERRIGYYPIRSSWSIRARSIGFFCCRCHIGAPAVVVDSRRKVGISDVVDIEMWRESYFDFFLGNSARSAPVCGLFVAEAEHEVSSIWR